MWKHREATNLLTRLFLMFVLIAYHLETARALSNKRLCADENCKKIISFGKGVINYRPGDPGMIAFNMNSDIRILSKNVGNDPSVWGIEVNGRKGNAPKRFIREIKVEVGDKSLVLVDVEPTNNNVPVLSTSEKPVEQNNILETTTTKPLNLTPSETAENVLNNSTNEKFKAETLPVATPVSTEIEGTNITVAGDEENQDTVQSAVSDAEKTKIVKDKSVNEHTSEISKAEINEIKEVVNEVKPDEATTINHNDNKTTANIAEQQQQTETKQEVVKTEKPNSNTPAVIDHQTANVLSVVNTKSITENPPSNLVNNELHINDTNRSEENIQDKVPSSTNEKANENEEQISKEQTTLTQVNIDNELKPTRNVEVKQENDTTLHQNDNKNAVANENNISSSNGTVTTEAQPKQTETKQAELKPEKAIDENLTTSVDAAVKDQTVHTEYPPSGTATNEAQQQQTETKQADLKPEKAIDENLTTSADAAVVDQTVNTEYPPSNLEHVTTPSSEIVADQQPSTNNVTLDNASTDVPVQSNSATDQKPFTNKVNLDKAAAEAEVKTNLTSEINETDNFNSEHKVQINKTNNYSPLPKLDTIVKDTATGSIEGNVKVSNDKQQENDDDTIVDTFELIKGTTDLPTFIPDISSDEKNISKDANSATVSSENLNEDNHVESLEKTSTVAVDDNNIDHSITNSVDLTSHNQLQSNNDPLQEPKVDNDNELDSNPTESLSQHEHTTLTTEHVAVDKSDSHEKSLPSTSYHTTEFPSQAELVVTENLNPTTDNPLDDTSSINTYTETENDSTYPEYAATSVPSNDNNIQHVEHVEASVHPNENHDNSPSTESYNNIPTTTVTTPTDHTSDEITDEPSKVKPSAFNYESKENTGLFATIMGTVNNMWTNSKKKQNEFDGDSELDRILYSQGDNNHNDNEKLNEETSYPYCKNIGPNGECPEVNENHDHSALHIYHAFSNLPLLGSDFTFDEFLKTLASKILEISELLAFLVIAAAASLFFVFGYYCFCNSSREGALLLKLNQLESSLLASHKENAILKHNLMSTRQKLASIEDNSFGSNDMVVSLKKELEEELLEKARLQEQITALQKELENAADAGIELNKIVSELLSNQTGDESIISSVEELQKQLNEQQNTIYEINASLAEKSRENSELQLMIAEQNARYEAEFANIQRDNDELEHEKGNLLTRLEEMKTDYDKDITAALEGKNLEIKRLQSEILDLNNKLENEHTKWQTSAAKIEALEECLKNIRRDPKVNINEVIDVANVKAQLIETQKMFKSLRERHEIELDSRKLAESQLELITAEVEKLKQDFNQSEKDKLEAQTRLEVLSNYFKDKENQLQKELSLKEAMWLKQQGETTTTVDRVTAMQEDIQSLKSQNDALRAEIEAQVAAHKAQIGTLENRAHETWLAARQSERRCEEARAEATALRRKLTALAGGNVNESNKSSTGIAAIGDELTQAPSPIHMESPGSTMLGRMPPPPFLPPPPFMGPHPPFMGMPPLPPFVPPGEMRPAPLGRIMSPPPQRSGPFSPQHLDYDDYLEYESNNSWHRHTYSPPPRTYRSLSPTDSRYNYGTERDLMSTYDTETDFSPPPSPRESRKRSVNSSERVDSSTKLSYGNQKKFYSPNKGSFSSGSNKSSNTHLHNETKTKQGNGGKNLV